MTAYVNGSGNGSTTTSAMTVNVMDRVNQLLEQNPMMQQVVPTEPRAPVAVPTQLPAEPPVAVPHTAVQPDGSMVFVDPTPPVQHPTTYRGPQETLQDPISVQKDDGRGDIEPNQHSDNPALDIVYDKQNKPTKEESFAALRRKLHETKEVKETLEQQVQQLTQTVEAYKTGEAIPDKIKELQDTITELREFEKLHNLKLSPEYRQKYVEPVKTLKEQGLQLARDYGIPEDVFTKALTYQNQRELNVFLSEHFDPIGAQQARDIIRGVQQLEDQRLQAETQPGEVYEQLLRETEQQQQQAKQQKFNQNKDRSLLAWKGAHSALLESEQFPELTITGYDTQHDSYAKPIVERAKTEFAKLVHYLSDKGVDLDDGFLNIMAKRMLLSEAAVITAKSRAEIYKQSQEVIDRTKQGARYDRPQVGTVVGGMNGNGNHKEPERLNPRLAADAVLKAVLG